MSSYTPAYFKTFTATAVAIGQFVRVKFDANGLISAASGSERAIGVAWEDIVSGGIGTVRLFEPTTFGRADGVITAADLVYSAAAGDISSTTTSATSLGMIALVTTALNDIVELARVR